MTTTTVNLNGRFTVDGYRGVAFYLLDYAIEEVYEGDLLLCPDEDCDHQLSAMCWAEGDTTIVKSDHMVRAVMVGDDREFIVDVDDLTEIPDDSYCPGCGQIGCGHR